MHSAVDARRIQPWQESSPVDGMVVYWMSRDQRLRDNWALLYAQELALSAEQPLAVVFCLVPEFLGATWRQYGFMLKGLIELEAELRTMNIRFFLLQGQPEEQVVRFCRNQEVGALVCDFSPLSIHRGWKKRVAENARVPFFEVDAHNTVPCWFVSPKQEYAAYTLRPKLHRVLPDFLTDIPPVQKHPYGTIEGSARTDWDRAEKALELDREVPEVQWLLPGEAAGQKAMDVFIREKLADYAEERNDPSKNGQSDLSPYLHFGQLSAQRLAYEVSRADMGEESTDAFLEELVVRKELSDNFCFHNPYYDSVEGFPRWAKETLSLHEGDEREYLYSLDVLEKGQTHDPLWNAAQLEMVKRGKMHGYMRMYWAKKILEWTKLPQKAMATAIYLNDKYSLDGRDPNGYVGIAWSIGGVHDRAWGERPIFGKIRYMSYRGSKSKFDVAGYLEKVAAYQP